MKIIDSLAISSILLLSACASFRRSLKAPKLRQRHRPRRLCITIAARAERPFPRPTRPLTQPRSNTRVVPTACKSRFRAVVHVTLAASWSGGQRVLAPDLWVRFSATTLMARLGTASRSAQSRKCGLTQALGSFGGQGKAVPLSRKRPCQTTGARAPGSAHIQHQAQVIHPCSKAHGWRRRAGP